MEMTYTVKQHRLVSHDCVAIELDPKDGVMGLQNTFEITRSPSEAQLWPVGTVLTVRIEVAE